MDSLAEESQKSDIQAGGTQYGASEMSEARCFQTFQARRKAPGRSCTVSNFEVWPGRLPVAVGFSAGFARASLALMARIFLLLFVPCFFLRCFWFGMAALHKSMVQSNFLFSEEVFGFLNFCPASICQAVEITRVVFGHSHAKRQIGWCALLMEEAYIDHLEKQK
jgi:hypothetical protein